MAERRVLWVSGEAPAVSLGGGSIRQAHLLRAVAERAETHLLLAGELRDDGLRRVLASVTEIAEPPVVPLMTGLGGSLRALRLGVTERRSQEVLDTAATAARLGEALHGVAGRGDIVQVEHTGLAPLVRHRRSGEQWAITLHTIESERATQRAAASASFRHRWLYGREAQRARRHERLVAETYDAVWVMSQDDAAAFAWASEVVPNGVDVNRYRPTALPAAPRIAFTGSLHYFPNIDGANWFCREVLPLIRARVPQATVTVAGRRPVPAVEALADLDGVSVLADVADMVPVVSEARVAVVPLRVGSGTRLKALEALAAGRPVIGTTIGLAGLDLRDGNEALFADAPAAFAEAVVRVLENDQLAAALADAGRRHAQRFSWDLIGDGFADALLSLPARSQR
jgi:glycosyltransferase involved in cell wall biosynthesis